MMVHHMTVEYLRVSVIVLDGVAPAQAVPVRDAALIPLQPPTDGIASSEPDDRIQHGSRMVCRRIIARPIFDSVRTEYHKIVTCSSSAHHTETRLPTAFSFMQDTTAPAAQQNKGSSFTRDHDRYGRQFTASAIWNHLARYNMNFQIL